MSTPIVHPVLPIRVNNLPRSVPGNSTLLSVLRDIRKRDDKQVVVALNGIFVRSADWADQHISSDDSLMVIESAG